MRCRNLVPTAGNTNLVCRSPFANQPSDFSRPGPFDNFEATQKVTNAMIRLSLAVNRQVALLNSVNGNALLAPSGGGH